MHLIGTQLISIYDQCWKLSNWESELLFFENNIIYLVLCDNQDFIKAPVGKYDGSEDICAKVKISDVKNGLKSIGSEKILLKIKNGKIQFSSDDNKNKLVITYEDGNGPDLEYNDKCRLVVPLNEANVAAKYANKEEYPFNFVYYDKDTSAVFSTAGYRIFGNYDFKSPFLALPLTLINALSFLCKDSRIEVIYDNGYIIASHSDKMIKFKAFEPDKDISVYYNLSNKPSSKNTFDIEKLLHAMTMHSKMNSDEVNIVISDNHADIFSSRGDTVALKSSVECSTEIDSEFSLKTSELCSMCEFVKQHEGSKIIHIGSHDKYQNIIVVFSDKYYCEVT